MNKWNMIIDVAKCEDCNNCFLACKDEHVDNEFPRYSVSQPRHGHRWIDILRLERGQYPLIDVAYRPTPCMHCDSAPCIKASKNNAVYKRDDGIVMIDPVKAKGQDQLIKACPYDTIFWNEEAQVPQKCSFCAHLIDDEWMQTRCVQACPAGSMSVVYVSDRKMKKIVEEEKLEILKPELNTLPRVYYKNLYRFDKVFIAGSICTKVDSKMECAKGAAVTLFNSSNEPVGNASSDLFGDFKIDALDENSGKYSIEVVYEDKNKKLEVELTKSVNLGDIEMI